MCGIAGIVRMDGQEVSRSVIQRMTDSVRHRGPDDEGVYVSGSVGLGHRRLSILDLSPKGRQPMLGRNSDYVLVYNGEVYNYVEIRSELESSGLIFHSNTDSEVILAAYETWGADCVDRFNGMWAFTIFDRKANKIFCSRDRFGIKPFYYHSSTDAFYFGSEIRQLLPLMETVRANRSVVQEFLYGGISEPFEDTFYEGVKKLPGGHNLEIDLDTNTIRTWQYFFLEEPASSDSSHDDDSSLVEYEQLLRDSVRLRLRSDVRVGTCLSGGLDSSTIAAIAAPVYRSQSNGGSFAAITAISEDASRDESPYAASVVERHGLEWFTVTPDYTDFRSVLPDVIRAQEEPFPTCSIIFQFLVMQTARSHGLPVLLDGQGGDETLLGYERYYAALVAREWKTKGLAAAVKFYVASCRENANLSVGKLASYLFYFTFLWPRYVIYRSRARFLKRIPPFPSGIRQFEQPIWDVHGMQREELQRHNLPALLRFEDKNSMWHAVETRLPFLDYRTLQKALSLDSSWKIRDGWTKYPLRRITDKILPKSIAWRRNKFGFEAPDKQWVSLFTPEMKKLVLECRLLEELTHSAYLEKHFEQMRTDDRWRLYSVAAWAKSFEVS